MPDGAESLSVAFQDSSLVLWAMVDPDRPKSVRRFRSVMTGELFELPAHAKFVGTAQQATGGVHLPFFVVHVFELG